MQRASLLFGASFLANAAFGYVFHLLLGRALGVADFGLVIFLESVLGICGLAIVNGYPPLATRLLSHAGDDRRGAILRATMGYNLLLAAAFAGALAAAWRLGLLDVGGSGGLLVALLCATLLLTAAGAILKAALQGEFRFERASAVLVAEQGVKLGAGIALAVAGLTVVGAMASLALAALAGVVLALAMMPRRLYRRGGRAPEGIAAMGLPMFLGVVSTSLLMTFEVPAIKLLLPSGEADVAAGLFGAAALLARFPAFLVGAMIAALFPFLARAAQANDHEMARVATGRAVRYVVVGVLPVSLFLALAPEASLRLLFPADYAAGAATLALLSPAMFLLAVATVYATLYQAASNPLVPAFTLLGATAAQLMLMVVLVPRYGPAGAAAATLAACALGLALLLWRFASDHGVPRFGLEAAQVAGALVAPVSLLLLVDPQGPVATVALAAGVLLAHVGGLFATRFLTVGDVRTTLALVLRRGEGEGA